MVVYDERGQSTSSAVPKSPMENGRFIKILQEIKQEIKESCYPIYEYGNYHDVLDRKKALEIIDTHISALNNDQFERIWNYTVDEMKRRKIK